LLVGSAAKSSTPAELLKVISPLATDSKPSP
jgi:hypothetical protein